MQAMQPVVDLIEFHNDKIRLQSFAVIARGK